MAEIDIYKLHDIAGEDSPELAFELFGFDHFLWHNMQVRDFFENSTVEPALRIEIFDKLYPKPSKVFKRTIDLLIWKDLMGEITWLAEKFASLVSEKYGVDVAELKVAFPPDGAFEDKIKASFGKGLMMKTVVDPKLIGGFLLRFHDGRTFDGSLKGKLSALRSEIAA